MEKPLISVIVPVYNIMEYLPRCVQSVMEQSWRELEILLVDDGSTDGTGKLCDELAERDSRIRVFHKENGGSSSARNLGLAHAEGEYIGFVDSDDYIDPDMYERLYEGIAKYHVAAAQIGRDEIDAEGRPLADICVPPARPECVSAGDFLSELLMHRGDCSFCTKLIRKDLFQGKGFPEGVLNEDFHLLVRMLPEIGTIVSLPGQAYHVFYRIGSNSRKADRESFSRVFGDCVDNADMISEIVKKTYPELSETALRFGVFQRLEYLLHIPISQMRKDNAQYRGIVRWIRRNWIRGMANAVLTIKNKCYLTLFCIAPKGIRKVHKLLISLKRGRKGVSGLVLLLAASLTAGSVLTAVPGCAIRASAEGAEIEEEARPEEAETGGGEEAEPEDLEPIAEARYALQSLAQAQDVMALVYLCDSYEIRETAGSDSAVAAVAYSGQTVDIIDIEIAESNGGPAVWAKVEFYDGESEKQGYIEREKLACSDERFLAWENEYRMDLGMSAVYVANDEGAAYPDIEQFPESYREPLTTLKEKHPGWTFVPLNTGLKWQTVIDNEIGGGKSLVHSSLADCAKEGSYDGGSWYYASEAILKYYMDPRNALTEDGIFQFELLTYNKNYHTEAAVEQFLTNTFMNGSVNAPGTDQTYANIFWSVGAEENRKVSPFHLAARVYQEQGQGTSHLISGAYPGFENYYNYFNIGATGKSDEECIVNGLTYAREHNWSDAYASIAGGADVISANYIKKGQDTLYLQKFNVNPSGAHALYTHQYMQNISAPATEGVKIKELYASAGSLENTFVFKIPVYNKMPGSACAKPKKSTHVVLEVPEGYDTAVWLDGVEYQPVRREERRVIVKAPDGKAKSAVVYQYNESGVPTGMYVWTLDYVNKAYRAEAQPKLKNLLSYHGFSIRITGKTGIRFKTGISKSLKKKLAGKGVNGFCLKEYGTLAMNNKNRSKYPMIKGGKKVAGGMAYGLNKKGKLEDHVFETVDKRQRYTSVLVDLPADQYKVEYAFRGYLTLEKDGEEIIIYGPVVARSIYALAEQVLNMEIYVEGSKEEKFLKKLIEEAE